MELLNLKPFNLISKTKRIALTPKLISEKSNAKLSTINRFGVKFMNGNHMLKVGGFTIIA